MRIDSSGQVGIGLSTPACKLDIYNSAAAAANNEILRLRYNTSTTAGHSGDLNFTNAAGTIINRISSICQAGGGAVDLAFSSYSGSLGERMRITGDGNLLIGRTSTVTNPASSGAIVYASSGYSTTDGTTTANYTKDRIYFNATNFYVLNGSSTGVVLPNGNTSWSAQSDERTKDIIEPIQNAIQKLSDFRCVIGKYKTDETEKRRVFLIAQDVQKVLPEAVTELDDENKTLALSYTDIIPLLTAAIQEQQAIIEELKATTTSQQTKIEALEARLTALENK
jgi:hypothetical protein